MMIHHPITVLLLFVVSATGACEDGAKALPLDPVVGHTLNGLDLDRDIVSTMGKQIYTAQDCPGLCSRFLPPSDRTATPTWLAPVITAVRADNGGCAEQECGSLRDALEGGDSTEVRRIQGCISMTHATGGACDKALSSACAALCERAFTHHGTSAKTSSSTGDAGIGLAWSFTPPQLMVYRPTRVRFTLDAPPRDHPNARCVWNVGTERVEGCHISHTFENGRADEWVTLELVDGKWRWKSTKRLPLERLPVVKLVDERPATDAMPQPPKSGQRSFRFAVIADSAAQGGVPRDVVDGVEALASRVKPDLVIHCGGMVAPQSGNQGWRMVEKGLTRRLAKAKIPAPA